jgi:FtsP/CotA-like multicopper oxidase with cupredoxin domain
MKKLSRRQLLDGSIGIGAFLLTAGAVRAEDPMQSTMDMSSPMDMSPTMGMVPDKPAPAMDQPLVEPEVRRSVNGTLSTTLRVGYAYRQIGGVRLYVRSYEGDSPGPTLRMKPGDTLRIKLINDLPPNRDWLPADISQPHQFNNTNFHFHGSHASPSGIADNVMRSMAPGHTTSRSSCRRTTPRGPTGITPTTTAAPISRCRAAWWAPSSSKAISPMCRR